MTEDRLVVAIDGTLGAGKSTVSRLVARDLGLPVVDTGATYRLVGLRAAENGIDLEDPAQVVEVARQVAASTTMRPDGVLVSGGDVVGAEIRRPEVSRAASVVAAHPDVRSVVVQLQRALVPPSGAVVEGRDIGTVVFPDADVKIFLDARPQVRAERRPDARPDEGVDALTALRERDTRDATRPVGAMRPAPDALLVDTSDRSPEEVAELVLDRLRSARRNPGTRVDDRLTPTSPPLLYRLIRGVLRGLLRGPFRLRIDGAEHIPARGPAILAPNHRSLVDHFVIGAITRRQVRFMGKEELFASRLGSRLLTALGAFPVRRGRPDRQSLRMALDALRRGELLGLYPEGTRDPGHRFQEIEEGLAYVALKAGAPIVPVAISGTDRVFPRDARLPRLVRIRVRCGEPFVLGGPVEGLLKRSRVKEATHEALRRLRAVMDALEPPAS